jgi:hypothetical protein
VRRIKHEKSELQLKIEQEFPFMRQKEISGEQWEKGGYSTYDAYGCCLNKGWYNVLRGLCLEITQAYETANMTVDVVVRQVKEKFGMLRFYCHPEGHDPGIFALDFIGSGSLRKSPSESELHKKINEIVRKWEAESIKVCEMCGAEAERRTDIGWIMTLCEPCYAKVKAKREEHDRKRKEREENTELWEAEKEAERRELRRQTLTADDVRHYIEGEPLEIDDRVRYINDDVFDALSWLDGIIVKEGNEAFATIDGVLFKNSQHKDEKRRRLVRYPAKKAKSPVSYSIPEGVTSIASNAFKGCENVTAVFIPKTMYSDVIWGVFSESGIKEITVHPDNPAFICVDGVLFSKYMTELHAYPLEKDGKIYDVPEGVRHIWHDAFKNARNLVGINVPDSVGWIGHNAFEGCLGLTKIALPNVDFNKNERVFYNCPKLERIEISLNLENHKPIRLHSCDGVLYKGPITYHRGMKPENRVEWTEYTLMRYPQAKHQDIYCIANGTSHILPYAFAGARKLKCVNIPASVTEIGEGAFEDCNEDLFFYCYEGSFALEYLTQQGLRFEALTPQPISVITGNTMTIDLNVICKSYSGDIPSELLKIAVRREIATAKENGIELYNISLITLPLDGVEMPQRAYYMRYNGVAGKVLDDAIKKEAAK